MLAKARATRRVAKFWLSTFPFYFGMIAFAFCFACFISRRVPFVPVFMSYFILLSVVSILPNDKSGVKRLYLVFFFVSFFYSLLCYYSAATGISEAEDGDECYADEIDPSLDDKKGIDCGWVTLLYMRTAIVGFCTMLCGIFWLKGFLTLISVKDLLDHWLYTFGLFWIFGSALPTIFKLIAAIGINAKPLVIADHLVWIILQTCSGLLHLYPDRFRNPVWAFLHSKIEHGTAAGVASFLGGKSPEYVQSTAMKLFRTVSLDQVDKEALAKSTPDPLLLQKTVPATLGHVDAFLSHSWHDDSELKWEQLQIYREEFKNAHGGREPQLWIDKYCLDQNNLHDGLMCLPVFLAGCNSLLVLAGLTYSRRLWCVMEIFIFHVMGGPESAVDLRLVCDRTDSAAHEALFRDLEKFDAMEAKCTIKEDEDRMQGAIVGVYGSLNNFNRDVQQMLGSILRRGGMDVEGDVEVKQQLEQIE